MRQGLNSLIGAAVLVAPFAWADVPEAAREADIVILGEFHDNPVHHAVQAQWVADLAPQAIVFEMLRPDEVEVLAPLPRLEETWRTALSTAHWFNIAEYVPIMLAADAQIVGAAAPPDRVRASFSEGAAAIFGAQAEQYGLTEPLPEDALDVRKTLQFKAHCEAMPLEMMGGMVEAQRFRDAAFSRAALSALQIHGAPVVVITGNGHARRDWGMPAYINRVAPDLDVFVVGQSEDGQPVPGGFDLVLDAPSPARGDPCAAFK